ncbi:MAG: hypothetical protein H0X02_02360 [Nitrosomonas sp.]|nr:hypothetical protein [Nitrosomonas sp.]
MKEKIKHPVRMLTLVVIAGAFIGLTGCATTGQIEEHQTKIAADIASAKADAAAAKAEAAAASAKANEAVSIANEANGRSKETESKIDRMFKKAMYK